MSAKSNSGVTACGLFEAINNQLLNIPNWTTGKVSQTETEVEEEEGEKEEEDDSGGFPHIRDALCC